MKLSTCSALVLMVLALSACGGGGGGGSTTASNTPTDSANGTGGGNGGNGGGNSGSGTVGATLSAADEKIRAEISEHCGVDAGCTERATVIADALAAVDDKGALETAWAPYQKEIDAQKAAARRGDPSPSGTEYPYLSLPVELQQALLDLYYEYRDAFVRTAQTPPAPPQTPPATPETGSYTSQNGPVSSWGVWRGDEPAPAGDQQRFSVNQLTDSGTDGFFANYQVTGTPTTSASLPSGTATWTGEYEGVYQLGDENGVWGARTEDHGTASIDVDFSTNEDAVTVTLTSATTDAKTFPGGGDTAGDVWTPAADLDNPKNTFNNNRVSRKPTEDEYSKIVGAVFGPNAEALAGVYEFHYLKDHATLTDGNNDPSRVNDIRGAGWFGGCKDVTDFSCFQADPVTDPDPDPVTDPPVTDPDPDPVTPPGTFSHLGFGPWADRAADFDAGANSGDFTAVLQGVEQFYLRGTRTSHADITTTFPGGLEGQTATWTGTYVGKYRTNPADDPQTDDNEHVWSVFADDSGTVNIVVDLDDDSMEVTLTSTVGNTFPGTTANVDTPKNSFAFDASIQFSGGSSGEFLGNEHDTEEADNTAIGTLDGAFFGPEAAEAGGGYSITQTSNQMGIQVEAVGAFGATKQP